MSKPKYIVSYGGGVNSTAMIIWLVNNKKPIDYVVFADVGNEVPETYSFIDKHMKPYLEKYDIPFKTVYVKRKISLWTNCFKLRKFPSMIWRWCTRDFKVRPIHKFYKSLKCNIIEYMGIDYDEVRRMKPSIVDHITKEYPLIDNKIGRDDCIKIIQKANLPIPAKSGCFFCPFNNRKRWAEIKEKHPDLFLLSIKLEKNSKHYPKQKLIILKNEGSEEMCDGVCMT